MAEIEKVTLNNGTILEKEGAAPGLRIQSRSTTSSLADYPDWRIDEIRERTHAILITDGTCS